MHRVELKVLAYELLIPNTAIVPNAPCGVERILHHLSHCPFLLFLMHRVELKVSYNAPISEGEEFLMHRVELKEGFSGFGFLDSSILVPNAPCGVESSEISFSSLGQMLFLMHRVELKAVGLPTPNTSTPGS